MLPDPLLYTRSRLGGPNCRCDVRASFGKGQNEVSADHS